MKQLKQAAHHLYEKLKEFPWLVSVGIAKDCIYVYTNHKKCTHYKNQIKKEIPVEWESYPVNVKNIGPIKPCCC